MPLETQIMKFVSSKIPSRKHLFTKRQPDLPCVFSLIKIRLKNLHLPVYYLLGNKHIRSPEVTTKSPTPAFPTATTTRSNRHLFLKFSSIIGFCCRFREELAQISREIKRRNAMRTELYKYTHLDPEFIPNSINI